MRKPEQQLWDVIRRSKPPDIWLERVENLVGEGTPDVHGCKRGTHAWIELKARAALPKRMSTPLLTKVDFPHEQIGWHEEYALRGGRSFIIVGIGSGRARTFMVVPGNAARVLIQMPMQAAILEFNIYRFLADALCEIFST
jgi:hypothetical protein